MQHIEVSVLMEGPEVGGGQAQAHPYPLSLLILTGLPLIVLTLIPQPPSGVATLALVLVCDVPLVKPLSALCFESLGVATVLRRRRGRVLSGSVAEECWAEGNKRWERIREDCPGMLDQMMQGGVRGSLDQRMQGGGRSRPVPRHGGGGGRLGHEELQRPVAVAQNLLDPRPKLHPAPAKVGRVRVDLSDAVAVRYGHGKHPRLDGAVHPPGAVCSRDKVAHQEQMTWQGWASPIKKARHAGHIRGDLALSSPGSGESSKR